MPSHFKEENPAVNTEYSALPADECDGNFKCIGIGGVAGKQKKEMQ